jgi:hypothetical protein
MTQYLGKHKDNLPLPLSVKLKNSKRTCYTKHEDKQNNKAGTGIQTTGTMGSWMEIHYIFGYRDRKLSVTLHNS